MGESFGVFFLFGSIIAEFICVTIAGGIEGMSFPKKVDAIKLVILIAGSCVSA